MILNRFIGTDVSPNGDGFAPGDGRLREQIAAAPDDEERLKAMFEASPDAVVVVGRNGFVMEVNRPAVELFEAGGGPEIAELQLQGLICPEYREAFAECLEGLWRGESSAAEFECVGLRGSRRWVEMHAAPVRGVDGTVSSFLGILRDTTAQVGFNKQFIQAQKMEVVGHLASGVAHDFNNMLGIIMGFSEMLMQSATPGSLQHEDAVSVFHTAERAAALTQQILLFSRDRTPRAQKVDLGGKIVEMDRMLRRLIGEEIKLVTNLDPELHLVESDPVQIEQVLMNLTVNARDAMPEKGTITIETSNATVRDGDMANPGVKPGEYAVMSVTDGGTGVTAEIKARIFEPFFTTKPAGRGTGLGLSTCQSIVQQWGGHITVESAPGAGSIFKVYLPCLARCAKEEKQAVENSPPPRGAETIMLVEDEPGLLSLTAVVLERQGYTVLKAGNGNEGLSVVRGRKPGSIDMVMTDMVMPEMSGRMMSEWLLAYDPGIRVLYTSGYTDTARGGPVQAGMNFIAKPYKPKDLLRKVREVIDSAGVPRKVAAGEEAGS